MPNNAQKSAEQATRELELALDFSQAIAGLGADVGKAVLETSAAKSIAGQQYELQSRALRQQAAGTTIPIAAPMPTATAPPPQGGMFGDLPPWLPWAIAAGAAVLILPRMMK